MVYSQKKRLDALCDVQTGYTARTALRPADGGLRAVQLSDLHGEADFNPQLARTYPLDPSLERYKVGPGDVLFRSRGDRNTAVVVDPKAQQTAIAILPIIILRPIRSLVEPRYLAWFINQPSSQKYFDSCARGTSMRMIPKASIDALEIELPDLATQRRIVAIDALALREHALAQRLADKKMELTRFALLAQARKAQPHKGRKQ
ncbi:MAG TPA: hypothetical protein VHE09_01920 [Rhizomicrobium sp.]|nr:hypothetical protein [Rhizomicrobium sp.]